MTKDSNRIREGPEQGAPRIRGVVLGLKREEVEAAVEKFERGQCGDVDSDTVQLLERYFLQHPEESELSARYDQALEKSRLKE